MEDIVAAALRFDLLWRMSKHLKARRDRCDACPRENVYDMTKDGKAPCWKAMVYSHTHQDEVALPLSEWCPSCIERQQLHDALVFVTHKRAGAERSLKQHSRALREKEPIHE